MIDIQHKSQEHCLLSLRNRFSFEMLFILLNFPGEWICQETNNNGMRTCFGFRIFGKNNFTKLQHDSSYRILIDIHYYSSNAPIFTWYKTSTTSNFAFESTLQKLLMQMLRMYNRKFYWLLIKLHRASFRIKIIGAETHITYIFRARGIENQSATI